MIEAARVPRQPRIEFAGAHYHVMARGDRREAIVVDDADREMFVRTMGEAMEKTGWQVLAWVLMDDHYHWVLRTPEPNLVAGMKWFQNAHTRRLNTRHRLWGHVFGGRYKAVLIEAAEGRHQRPRRTDYLAGVIDYAHLNPVRAGLVALGEGSGLLDYRWSSLSRAYARPPSCRPAWMDVTRGLAIAGLRDTVAGRRSYVERLERLAQMDAQENCGAAEVEGQTLQSTLRRGWYWGSQQFRCAALKLVDAKRARSNPNYRASKLGRCKGEALAREILEDACEAFAIEPGRRKEGPGSAAWKVVVASALTQRTTVSHRWIAEEMGMRSPGNVSQQVRRLRLGQIQASKEQQRWLESIRNV